MINQQTIKKILEVSINAPSGSNSQPWRFEIKGDRIAVIAEPEKDHQILNYRHRGTWLAHGALVENIKIAANAFGLRPEIKFLPDRTKPNHTAQIGLTAAPPSEETLFQVIPERTTNRHRFDLRPLTAEQLNYLKVSFDEVGGGVEAVWISDRQKINRLGQAAAANEIVTLENEKLHRLFFDEIVWTKGEEAEKKKGLFVKTMELKPPEEWGLKLFRRWSVMRRLATIGMARKIATGNAKNYAATPLIGLVVVKDDDLDFVLAGRVIERIWLKATRLGLGFHLITGTMFFWQGINLGGLEIFAEEHRQLINNEYGAIADIASISGRDRLVTAMFRVGRASGPSARSTKQTPRVEFV